MSITLPAPARYFPLEKGLYEVAPGLHPITRSFGNGALDFQAFHVTASFPRYRENKLRCRAERPQKYRCERELPAETSSAVNAFLVERLCLEHPDLFTRQQSANGCILHAHHSGDRVELDERFELRAGTGDGAPFHSAFDALCMQFECDLAVVQTTGDGADWRDWLAEIHLCAPSHWAAEDKIGLPFTAIHAPIPHIEKVNAAAETLVRAMIHRGPYVRFVWGFATDDHLNHHPEPPPGVDAERWRGRAFDANRGISPFLLRIERQVTWGLPAVNAALFGIHVSFIEGAAIRENPRKRELFASALRSLSPASRVYKSIDGSLDHVLAYLEGS